jgi:DNA-binding winged helix-turn-helix (wHTH) protein/TolB-like protein
MTSTPHPIDLAHEASFQLGPAEVRPATREVVLGGTSETLEPRVMQVLVMLYRHRGDVVARDDLVAHCWGRVVGDDAINRCIARLRRLAESSGGFTIETIPRIGHRLHEAAIAERAPPADPEPIPPPAASRALPPRWLLIALLAVILLSAAAYWLVTANRDPSRETVVQAPPRLSIAVLPFTPLYNDPDANNLGDSIALSVADTLSSGTRFVIIAPSKSFQYRGAAKAGAAQALHADFVIDGEVRRTPGWITVTVRAIEGRDGTTVRSVTVSRPSDRADTIGDDIATRVAGFGWVTASGFSVAARWDAHVMAAHLRANDKIFTSGDPSTAYEITRRVAAERPDDAFALHQHAVAISYWVGTLPPEKQAGLIAEAKALEERVIRLDPGYGDAYIVLQATTRIVEWAERERLLNTCLSLVPESVYGKYALSEFLQSTGRLREAEPVIEATFQKVPYQESFMTKAFNSRIWLGRPAEARPLIDRFVRIYMRKGMVLANLFEATAFNGDLATAEEILRDPAVLHVYEPETPSPLYGLVIAALKHRRPDDIAAVTAACSSVTGRPPEIRQTCFLATSALGRLDEAFRIAADLYPDLRGASDVERQRKAMAHYVHPTRFLFVPATAALRADPRFTGIAARLGLLDYWKSTRRLPDFCAAEVAPVCAQLTAR